MRLSGVVAVVMLLAVSCSAQDLQAKTYGTSGHPGSAVWTSDGKYVLVTVTVTGERGAGSGVEVFQVEADKLKRVALQKLGNEMAQGIVLIPHSHWLAVGVSNAGVAFLPLEATLEGKATPTMVAQGPGSGSGYLAVAPDGQTLFVANEYGEGGNLGVIALHRDEAGEIHPEAVAKIPTPRATPGVAISHDGSRVYVVDEIMRADIGAQIHGHGVPELERSGCMQGSQGRPQPNGAMFTVDVVQAAAWTSPVTPEQIRAAAPRAWWTDAGCSPVREVVSADGKLVYVTARGDNRVLVFEAKALEQNAEHVFVRAIDTGGEAPVGLALFDGDTKLLVANSNRFAGGTGNVAVIDLSKTPKPAVVQKIKTGEFPRNVTASPDGKTLLVTIFLGNELMVLH